MRSNGIRVSSFATSCTTNDALPTPAAARGSYREVAAVHRELDPRDVRRFVRGQEQYRVRDLFHPASRLSGTARSDLSRHAGSADAFDVRIGGMMPGWTELTRIPCCANCTAADLVMMRTAPFDAL